MRPRGDGEGRPAVQVIGTEVQKESADNGRWRKWITATFLLVGSLLALIAIFRIGVRGETPVESAPPRLLAQPGPVSIDATTPRDDRSRGEWHIADVDATVRLTSVTATETGFVATGYDNDGPGLWRSPTGEHWELSNHLEPPTAYRDGPDTWPPSLRLLAWNGSIVVFGRVGDTTAVWFGSEFQGLVEGLDMRSSTVVAGDRLLRFDLALPEPGDSSQPDSLQETWSVSDNGVDWSEIEPVGLPEGRARPLGWVDRDYYASGPCWSGQCASVAYRSTDATTWEAMNAELPEPDGPAVVLVTDVIGVGEGTVAIGIVQDDLGERPLLWRSTDGGDWSLVPFDDVSRFPEASLELVSVSPEAESAVVAVNGAEFELSRDSVIITDVGPVTVTAIAGDQIRLGLGDLGGATLRVDGPPLTLARRLTMSSAAAVGSRVAIAGSQYTWTREHQAVGDPVATILMSGDDGTTWDSSVVTDSGLWIDTIALTDDAACALGYGAGGYEVWYYTAPANP